MKAHLKFFLVMICMFFTLLSLVAATDIETRKELMDASRKELLTLAQNEVSRGDLGEWKNIIDSSLFMLFRRTELFRGTMHIMVIDNPSVTVKLYPEGTFVLSTGLLDYIDASLFETASESPRRMRNFDSEREAALIPFLVPEAAHFALDHFFIAYKQNPGLQLDSPYSANAVLEADRFSVILLQLSGFDPSVLDVWFEKLKAIYRGDDVNGIFLSYFSSLPSPEIRASSIQESRENIIKTAVEFSQVLASLRTGTAFAEAQGSLEALREIYPFSSYIDRLEAFILHRMWLATVPSSVQRVKTFFPVADEDDPSRKEFISIFNTAAPDFPPPSGMNSWLTIPGDSKIYIGALEAYKRLVPSYPDSGFSSAYAMLLIWSGNPYIRDLALTTAEEAALGETGNSSFTARANYASLLFLTGKDYAKAQFLLDSLFDFGSENKFRSTTLLDQGVPGDERDILLNSALMLLALGDTKRAEEKKDKLEILVEKTVSSEPVSLRQIQIGDTIDELVDKWGRPAEIFYNYFTENWDYPSLSASLQVVRDLPNSDIQRISLIRLGPGSPVSPGGEIRTGDTRADFENVFGKPVYRHGDCEVYLKNGNRIAVFYLAGKIRNIFIGF